MLDGVGCLQLAVKDRRGQVLAGGGYSLRN